ncbi:ribosomal protein S18 acetylase RimI-like enzyme [Pullulanibacillus pueri]|uniref:N-acetyltransferase n=1 Tax=Pullulanibacillus pueri TaxID=1437324 RepID=A0A8J3EKK7_9BACL|nr:GNAT family N-acetyltransferase [Pullulanibacillus pueri]MBM7680461.1 ribosomal protein S18 acetylase RimI-like enzyme [Pullulanibacillus pueri]GGH74973.1 N-acetyltransferase [Pullulanibacillus pueri]
MARHFTFRPIDVFRDRQTIIDFRKDSYIVSFGTPEELGDEDMYVAWMAMAASMYPKGFVIMEYKGVPVGQIELEMIVYEGRPIGYVDLFYLIPEFRGKGYGKIQIDYAENYFKNKRLSEYHLRVSPTNKRALRFYEKHGMKPMMTEYLTQKVIRMRKQL